MNEKEFWSLLGKGCEKGRAPLSAGTTLETETAIVRGVGDYLEGHSILPEGYEDIPVETIAAMGELLRRKGVRNSTKEAVMMVLAHHGCDEACEALRKYLKKPAPALKIFAEIALAECEMWNED